MVKFLKLGMKLQNPYVFQETTETGKEGKSNLPSTINDALVEDNLDINEDRYINNLFIQHYSCLVL